MILNTFVSSGVFFRFKKQSVLVIVFRSMAVVRLKRRYNENPVDVLLFASKRLKTDEGDNVKDTLFTFAATVDNKDEDSSAFACVNKVLRSEELKPNLQDKKSIIDRTKKISDLTEKLRKENQLHSLNSRYQVVSLLRNIKPDDSTDEGECTPMTVIDIVNHEKTPEEIREEDYVYDLYYTKMGGDLDEMISGDTYSIHPLQEECYAFDEEENEHCDDDEDSNEENNYRNDYPDEEDVEDGELFSEKSEEEGDYEGDILSYGEDPDVSDIAKNFIGRCCLADSEDDMYSDEEDENELSSDEREEKIYDEDLVFSHSSYGTYVKKKRRADYKCDIDEEDDFS